MRSYWGCDDSVSIWEEYKAAYEQAIKDAGLVIWLSIKSSGHPSWEGKEFR